MSYWRPYRTLASSCIFCGTLTHSRCGDQFWTWKEQYLDDRSFLNTQTVDGAVIAFILAPGNDGHESSAYLTPSSSLSAPCFSQPHTSSIALLNIHNPKHSLLSIAYCALLLDFILSWSVKTFDRRPLQSLLSTLPISTASIKFVFVLAELGGHASISGTARSWSGSTGLTSGIASGRYLPHPSPWPCSFRSFVKLPWNLRYRCHEAYTSSPYQSRLEVPQGYEVSIFPESNFSFLH